MACCALKSIDKSFYSDAIFDEFAAKHSFLLRLELCSTSEIASSPSHFCRFIHSVLPSSCFLDSSVKIRRLRLFFKTYLCCTNPSLRHDFSSLFTSSHALTELAWRSSESSNIFCNSGWALGSTSATQCPASTHSRMHRVEFGTVAYRSG